MSPIARCCKLDEMPEDLRWNAATIWVGPKCHIVHYPLQGWKTFNLVATFVTDLENVGSNEPGKREEVLAKIRPCRAEDPQDPRSADRMAALGTGRSRSDTELGRRQRRPAGRCRASDLSIFRARRLHGDGRCRVPVRQVREKRRRLPIAAFKAYETDRIPRAYRVVLSSRELGRVFHVDGVERLVRNAWLRDKTPEEFNHSLRWLYGGNGLVGVKAQSAAAERAA